VAPLEDNCLGHVLVSVASESTGKAQTCRNELFALFGIWIGWADKSLAKEAAEEQDKQLRNEARRLYIGELAKSGVTVSYQRFANNSQSVIVCWDGLKMEREVKEDGRSAARNSFVALLRKRVESSRTHVTQWPIPDRPLIDPRAGAGALLNAKADGDVDYASLHPHAHIMYASSGVRRPAPANQLAPAKPKASGGGKTSAPAGSVKGAKTNAADSGEPANPALPVWGGASVYANAPSATSPLSKELKEILERGGVGVGAGSVGRACSYDDPAEKRTWILQSASDGAETECSGPGAVALLFVTDEDVRNGAFWERWLLSAPAKSYTIYVHAKQPDKVVAPLFKDSLVNEISKGEEPIAGGASAGANEQVREWARRSGAGGTLTSKSSSLMEHSGGRDVSRDAGAGPIYPSMSPLDKGKNGAGGGSVTAIRVLLKEALKERSNKWFMVLNDASLPMVSFSTFYNRMAQPATESVFDVHPEKVQTEMLGILKIVADQCAAGRIDALPPLVREAIEHKDLVAHSPIGTMLVRRDAQALSDAPSAALQAWFLKSPLC
jgi:hypothetical protein